MAESFGNHRNREWDEECGRQLELLIGLRGFSIGEFARRVEKTEKAVYKWRTAESEPLTATKAKIVEVLGGYGDPIWDDVRFRELAICLGARRRHESTQTVLGVNGPANGAVENAPSPAAEADDRIVPPSRQALGVSAGPPGQAMGVAIDPSSKKRIERLVLVGGLWIVTLVIAAVLFRNNRNDADRAAPVAATTPDFPIEVVANERAPWHITTASGAVVPLAATLPRNGAFSFAFRKDIAYAKVVDLVGGDLSVLIVSLDTSQLTNSTGHVRADCFARTGTLLWTHFVDDTPAFADTTYASNSWSLEDVQTLDWNADGWSEILLLCTHTHFPSVLVVLDAEGRRLTEYWNAGHMRRMVPLPADAYRSLAAAPSTPFTVPRPAGPGPALALSVEFQEPPRGAGMVLLAPGFAAGAYPAATVRYRHGRLPPERDGVFVRFQPSIVAQAHPAGQNWPENIDYDPTSRTIRITTSEEPEQDGVLRSLDHALRQVAVTPTDRFRQKFPLMQRTLGLPDITSDAMAASFETIAYRTGSAWQSVRFDGTWKP